jgi:hypothetical protein
LIRRHGLRLRCVRRGDRAHLPSLHGVLAFLDLAQFASKSR